MELKKYKHIVWDWNGTLLNDVSHCIQCMNQLLAERRMPLISVQQYQNIFTFPVQDYYKSLGFDFKKESFDFIGHAFMDLYFSNLSNCGLHSGVHRILTYFQEHHQEQFILSAMEHQALISSLHKMQIYSYFKGTYGIDNHLAAGKIDRAKQMFQENNIDIHQTVLIGDTIHDQEVADTLGCQVILIANGHQSIERLEKTGAKVLKNLDELIKC